MCMLQYALCVPDVLMTVWEYMEIPSQKFAWSRANDAMPSVSLGCSIQLTKEI